MALQIELLTKFGTPATYWKIVETNINWHEKRSHITLAGWIDKQARLDGHTPIDFRTFDWSGTEYPFETSVLDEEDKNALTVAYEKIKSLSTTDEEGNVTLGEFANAVNC